MPRGRKKSTHSKATCTRNFIFDSSIDCFTQVRKESALLSLQETNRSSVLEGMRPKGNCVHDWRLSRRHQRRNVPNQGALHAEQLFRLHLVGFVQQNSGLILAALKLIQDGFGFWPDVQLGRIVDEEDDVGPIDEPLAGVVEREISRHLLSDFQNSRNLHNIYLKTVQLGKQIVNYGH